MIVRERDRALPNKDAVADERDFSSACDRFSLNLKAAGGRASRACSSLAFVTRPTIRRLADQAPTVLEAGRLGMAVRPTKPEFGNPLFL